MHAATTVNVVPCMALRPLRSWIVAAAASHASLAGNTKLSGNDIPLTVPPAIHTRSHLVILVLLLRPEDNDARRLGLFRSTHFHRRAPGFIVHCPYTCR